LSLDIYINKLYILQVENYVEICLFLLLIYDFVYFQIFLSKKERKTLIYNVFLPIYTY